jgi:hypothetical protein
VSYIYVHLLRRCDMRYLLLLGLMMAGGCGEVPYCCYYSCEGSCEMTTIYVDNKASTSRGRLDEENEAFDECQEMALEDCSDLDSLLDVDMGVCDNQCES